MTEAGADPIAELAAAVLAGDRRLLARAITLVESARPEHQRDARVLVERLAARGAGALRIGVSGAPGVGKSTFIEALGLHLIACGRRPAVLAVDPSSRRGGGSLLADKTRMTGLARDPRAFIRPQPAGAAGGGVAARTREVLLLCAAAGFDPVIVETVGVGQAEGAVAGMTDLMILLESPFAGDELQAMKRGLLELADLVLVNKADLDPGRAAQAQQTLAEALALHHRAAAQPAPPVLMVAALAGRGIPEVWAWIASWAEAGRTRGELARRRQAQALDWMWQLIDERLSADFRGDPEVRARLTEVTAALAAGTLTPAAAAERLLEARHQAGSG